MQVPIILTLRAFIECPRPRKCEAFTRCAYSSSGECLNSSGYFSNSIHNLYSYYLYYFYYNYLCIFQFLLLPYLLVFSISITIVFIGFISISVTAVFIIFSISIITVFICSLFYCHRIYYFSISITTLFIRSIPIIPH